MIFLLILFGQFHSSKSLTKHTNKMCYPNRPIQPTYWKKTSCLVLIGHFLQFVTFFFFLTLIPLTQ